MDYNFQENGEPLIIGVSREPAPGAGVDLGLDDVLPRHPDEEVRVLAQGKAPPRLVEDEPGSTDRAGRLDVVSDDHGRSLDA
ncbi:MAG: hypothetical protein HGA41_11085, partial [Syntrophaceae bacterium]|nr:hypothetical protein [Syntrophaceae bacterium]